MHLAWPWFSLILIILIELILFTFEISISVLSVEASFTKIKENSPFRFNIVELISDTNFDTDWKSL